jgi:hypothetical protein
MKDNADERLVDIGFENLARWKIDADKLAYELTLETPELRARLKQRAALYAFTSEGIIFYIGKSALSLAQRFAGYRSPSPTQSTNIRCHAAIRELLGRGKEVQILSLGGLTPLRWGEFELNIAAGLEDSLIAELQPRWNGGKTRAVTESEMIERDVLALPLANEDSGSAPKANVNVARDVIGEFDIELGKTYYTQGIINPGAKVSDKIGADGEPMMVRLGWEDIEGVQIAINRRANLNGSPRLFGCRAVALWFQKYFQQGDVVHARIINRNEIVLERPATS